MNIIIISVGRVKVEYSHSIAEYLKRMQALAKVSHVVVKDKDAYKVEVLLAASQGSYRIACDEHGEQYTSQALSDKLEKLQLQGRAICFIIGGPDGLPQTFLDACDEQLSLSKLTMPHDLALLVLSEALYRAMTINAGHPYHRQ